MLIAPVALVLAWLSGLVTLALLAGGPALIWAWATGRWRGRGTSSAAWRWSR